jgi:hypothetical protein
VDTANLIQLENQVDSSVQPNASIGLQEFILLTIGVGAFLGGISPVFLALNASNELIDRGATNAPQVIAQWESWAFTWSNLSLIVFGLVMIGIVVVKRRRTRQ